jgi:hypothetical protein
MAKVSLAIAAGFLLAMTASAGAEGPSYESRGYGGPLYVGPNFQAGGQHGPPIYDTNPSSREHHKKKRTYEAIKSHKAHPEKEKETDTAKSVPEKSAPEKDEVESENSSIARASTGADEPSGGKVAAKAGTENENSSISAVELTTGTTAEKSTAASDTPKTTTNVGCKKYFPTAGMTLSVPCD